MDSFAVGTCYELAPDQLFILHSIFGIIIFFAT